MTQWQLAVAEALCAAAGFPQSILAQADEVIE